jgi:UrcA family protein
MTNIAWAFPVTCLAFVAGLAVDGGAARAQQGNTLEEITVVAPRLVTRTEGRTPVGGKVELISLTRHVVYKDLNLTVHNDVMALEKRVNDVAKEACDTLAKMYPLSDPNTPNCVEQATKDAKKQVDQVVAAAGKDRQR